MLLNKGINFVPGLQLLHWIDQATLGQSIISLGLPGGSHGHC